MPKTRSRHKKRHKGQRPKSKQSYTETGGHWSDSQDRTRAGTPATCHQPGATTDVDDTKQTLDILKELSHYEDWQIPSDVYQELPKQLRDIISIELKDKRFAYAELRQLHKDNVQKSTRDVSISQRNYYLTRHSRAEDPEPDEEIPQEVEAVSFHERVSPDEQLEVAHELQQLGLLELLIHRK